MTRLLRLDILALLLTSLVTAGVLVVGAERVAKLVFFQTGLDICEASHAMANCTGVFKLPEGPLVVNQYNDCGYRTAESCGSKPANGIRVAIVGTLVSAQNEWHVSWPSRATTSPIRYTKRPSWSPSMSMNTWVSAEASTGRSSTYTF